MSNDLKLTYDEIRLLPDGLRVLQQSLMAQAASDQVAAQKAMDIAVVLRHVLAELGTLQRNMELLLAEYGVKEGQQFVLDNSDPAKMQTYGSAVENLLTSTRPMPFAPIELSRDDIQNMAPRPDALAALSPIVFLAVP